MTQPPVPWKDDPELDPGLRSDLREIQEHAGAYDRGRGLVRLEAAIATGAAGAAGVAQAAAGSGKAALAAGKVAGGSLLGGTLAKVVGVGVAVVSLTSAVWVGTRTPEKVAAPETPARVARVQPMPAAATESPAQQVAPAAIEPPLHPAEPSPVAPPAKRVAPSSDPDRGAESRDPATPPTGDSAALRQEMAQLQLARALLEQDPEAAHAQLQRSDRRFADGLFVEERAALSVLALAGMGRLRAAHAEARAFAGEYPQSSFNARIRSALDSAESGTR